jgi:hypothetical protein
MIIDSYGQLGEVSVDRREFWVGGTMAAKDISSEMEEAWELSTGEHMMLKNDVSAEEL